MRLNWVLLPRAPGSASFYGVFEQRLTRVRASETRQNGDDLTSWPALPERPGWPRRRAPSACRRCRSSTGRRAAVPSDVHPPVDAEHLPGHVGRRFRAQVRHGGGDVFVHYSAIEMDGFKTLDEGIVVEYELVNGPKGKQAERVMRVQ